MPANVDNMFSVREMPWHRKGEVLPDYPGSWKDARVLAGLAWDPVTEPVYSLSGDPDSGESIAAEIEGWGLISRNDTGAVLYIAQNTFQLITNTDMGEIIEAVLDQANVKYETAGCLEGGRAVWCLARLDEPIELPGDNSPTMPFLAVTNRHQPGMKCTLRATAVRIVCANTFRAAELEGEQTGATYGFVHRGSWKDRLEEAKQAVTRSRDEFKAYAELAAGLMQVKVTSKQREMFIHAFIPAPPDGLITDRVARNVDEARSALRAIFDSRTTQDIQYTAYGLLQAAGEYLDHVRAARSWETRLNRSIMRPEPFKAKALNLIREVVYA